MVACSLAALVVLAAACSSSEVPDVEANETTTTTSTTEAVRGPLSETIAPPRLRPPEVVSARALPEPDTRPVVERLPDLSGRTITVLGPETDVAAESLLAAFDSFEELTGARIEYTGTVDDVTLLDEALAGRGEIPDVVVVAQPGRLGDLAELSAVEGVGARPLPRSVEASVQANFDEFWSDLVRFDGAVYGVPSKASVKSLVWYSPDLFAELEYEVPTTWDELETLSRRMRFEGRTPWCIGIEAGDSTGAVVTDWIEDLLLRRLGPTVYDQWVAHQIPANDPAVIAVVDEVGEIFHTPGNVLVDRGVQDIATTGFAEAGLPVLDGACMMHRQGSFYGSNYAAEGAEFGTDIDAFYLPTVDDSFGQVVLGAGDYFVSMRTDAGTAALLTYVADPAFANARASASEGGFLSANRRHDTSLYRNPIDRRIADVLVQADPFRFDGSDLMPAVVGAGELWRAGTSFATDSITTEEFLDRIEAAWSLAG